MRSDSQVRQFTGLAQGSTKARVDRIITPGETATSRTPHEFAKSKHASRFQEKIMKSQFAIVVAACGAMLAQSVEGQIRQPDVFRSVSATRAYYQDVENSPSDQPAASVASRLGGATAGYMKGGDGKGGACDTCCDSVCACDDGPCRLFPEIGCGWNLTGWIAAGATANADNPASGFNGPVTFNDRNRFQVNQFYMSFGRDVDTGGCGFDWGARVDLLYGTDYIFTQAAGLELRQNGNRHWNRQGNQYGLALPQAYAEVGYDNVRAKIGHFYTIIGNEVVTAPDNFFYSHAYTMQYGEPFTHTGGLVTWDYSDEIVLHGGLVNGWDKFDAVTDQTAFLGGINYTPCDRNYSLAFALITGQEDGIAPPLNGNRTMYSIVFTYDVNDSLQYVLQHDNGWEETAAVGVDNEWYGINQYLFYTINDCWKAGARMEWFRDDDGARLSAAPVRNGGGGVAPANLAGNYYNISLGLNWTPTSNIIVRPEIRWDWSDGTVAQPFDDGTKDSQMTAAFDAIWLY